MKKKYIQPQIITHHLMIETAVMVVSKSRGSDYTGTYDYKGLDPNVSEQTEESTDITDLPGFN